MYSLVCFMEITNSDGIVILGMGVKISIGITTDVRKSISHIGLVELLKSKLLEKN